MMRIWVVRDPSKHIFVSVERPRWDEVQCLWIYPKAYMVLPIECYPELKPGECRQLHLEN